MVTGVAVALAGMKLYVRPKEAMERVVGGIDQPEQMPSHPSLVFHDLIKKLGNIVPQSPKDVTVMQRRLIRAGIRNPQRAEDSVRRQGRCGGAAAADHRARDLRLDG